MCLHLSKNLTHSFADCAFEILNSIVVQRECKGSIILFLKLHVRINLQFAENSSINPRSAGCVD